MDTATSPKETDQPTHNQTGPTVTRADDITVSERPHVNAVLRTVVTAGALIAAGFSLASFMLPISIAFWENKPWILNMIQQHFAAIVGAPLMALLAFVIVVMLEVRFDKIEMELFNVLKFRGASGPIILWVVCFVSMCSCVKLLW